MTKNKYQIAYVLDLALSTINTLGGHSECYSLVMTNSFTFDLL